MPSVTDYKTKQLIAFDRKFLGESRGFAFSAMVNEVAAQPLNAIKVLGYLLGALAGGQQPLARF